MITVVRGLGAVAIAAIATGVWAGPAEAAIVSGSSLAAKPEKGTCYALNPGEAIDCTVVNSTLPPSNQAPGGTRAGIDGVIVSWRVKAGASSAPHSIGLRVVHGIEDGGAGPRETLPATAGEYSYTARVPVRAGDEIGLDLFEVEETNLPPVLRELVMGGLLDFWYPQLAPGGSQAPTNQLPEYELLMNATIEADADRDGFGDETQDRCPTAPGPGACPPPMPKPGPATTAAPLARPDTAISKGPTGTVHSRTAVFRFRSDPPGATFECKFDKRPIKRCSSPRRYKHLGLGSHRFQVRAVNAGGVDPFPATRSFEIAP